ncbi:jacalin-like lectin [Chromobacterium sp. ASV23]|uniref:jacalin-like lectin n=1 Tax=Chromobacterium sp. ASV23 TaxID=2795110 RepID=UPI0018EAF106
MPHPLTPSTNKLTAALFLLKVKICSCVSNRTRIMPLRWPMRAHHAPDDHLGRRVGQLSFTTNLDNAHGPQGGSGGSPFSLSSTHVGGFFGRSGSELDAIGFFNRAGC